MASRTVTVTVQTPGDVPPVTALVTTLQGQTPDGIAVVETTLGEQIDAGTVGG